MKYKIVLFLFLFSLYSCKRNERDTIVSVLKYWEQREIFFPNKLVFSIQGKDTVGYSINEGLKIVSYVDSIGCTSCKLKLGEWKAFINEIDSLCISDDIQFLFFFASKNKNLINRILLYNKFLYPVCVDEKDSINKLNNFPSDAMFQTFLLDKSNKVVAMGNPIYNPKVKELYLNIILGKKTLPSSSKKFVTTISLSKDTIDLGSFFWLEKQEGEIIISNTGNVPLVINDIITSCGCMAVEYDKKPICPGNSVSIRILYEADHPEYFDKTITVYCNAKNAPFKLKVRGNAK